MRQHYLGFKYCVPQEAGLASEARAVGKRLGKLLDALGDVNEWIVEQGELTRELWLVRSHLIEHLKADGWVVTIPKNNYIVKPPKVVKK